MKKKLSVLLMMILLLTVSLPSNVMAIGDSIYYVNHSYLNVRRNPSTSSDCISRLYLGDEVSVIDWNVGDGWAKIYSKACSAGYAYVANKYLTRNNPKKTNSNTASSSNSNNKPTGTYKVTESSMNVRASASANSKIVGNIGNGKTFSVNKTDGKWGYVPNYKGWVNLGYCKKVDSNSSSSSSISSSGTKNGYKNENGTWKYYENGEVKFASNDMKYAFDQINGKTSSTSYYIAVDTGSNPQVYIFTAKNGKWTPYKSFDCSVGSSEHKTPTGTYSLKSRWGVLKSGTTDEYYPILFKSNVNGSWCFHSTLYYKGTYKPYDSRLNQHISHGCIRLQIDNEKWIYDNCAKGTAVTIYEYWK